ncbi:MAG: hypothetical protein JW995_10465 [Melioribacteraceae bacterium]|nr:hypothetical protein [Melioribacteraceae bacterium]
MLNYNLSYHIIEEKNGEYYPKLSFDTYDDALEFLRFAPEINLFIVTSEELEDYIDEK